MSQVAARFFFDFATGYTTVGGMISSKPWRLEAMLRLGLSLMLCIWFGALLRLLLSRVLPKGDMEALSFYGFVISAVTSHGAGIVLVHYFLKWHQVSWREFLGGVSPQWRRALAWGAGVSLLATPVTLGLNWVSEKIMVFFEHPPQEQFVMQVLQSNPGWGQRLFFVFSAIVLAPVAEEIFFRGILYPWIKQRGYPMLALAGTSLLFGAIHGNLLTFVPLTFLAMCFVFVYEKTDAILAPIAAHSMFNTVNLALYLVPWMKLWHWWQRLWGS